MWFGSFKDIFAKQDETRIFHFALIGVFAGLLSVSAGVKSEELPRGELKQGRYTGWIRLDERNERIAVVTDFFLESPDDLTQFPKLIAAVRMNLGGYSSHEYLTEMFKSLKYDFDNGNLTFDESDNDLLLTTKVYKQNGRVKILGQAFVRSSALTGSIELLEESDEPGGNGDPDSGDSGNNIPFVRLLEGQYEGECDGKAAALQIQTVRGLQSESSSSAGLEGEFGIGARLAFKDDSLCGRLPGEKWCTRRHYSSGTYNFHRGSLILKGEQASDSCQFKENQLACHLRVFDRMLNCNFTNPSSPSSQPKFFKRRHHVYPTPEQNQDLPPPEPPQNEELTQVLRGSFFGYVHNEANDTYLPIKLDVIPYSSTTNPHNPNQMNITSVASLYLKDFDSGASITQSFESRSFYIRPGFTISDPTSDAFMTVIDWKKGFVRGVWYSHSFGRVGTVQLVKGEKPTLPAEAKRVQNFSGEFVRQISSRISQWINFLFPVQPNALKGNVIQFTGAFQAAVGTTAVSDIDRGTFDPYTGRIGWLVSRDDMTTLGSGRTEEDGSISLFWPPNPRLGTVANSYIFESFKKKQR